MTLDLLSWAHLWVSGNLALAWSWEMYCWLKLCWNKPVPLCERLCRQALCAHTDFISGVLTIIIIVTVIILLLPLDIAILSNVKRQQ